MSKEKFLTEKQTQILQELDWDVKPSGAFFHFKKDDFKKDYIWNQLCQTTGQDPNSDTVFILLIGSKTN